MINSKYKRESIDELITKLSVYDIISFDVFDTLILRNIESPTDLFRLLSTKYNMVDFYKLRKKAQANARLKKRMLYGHEEVNLYEIYDEVSALTNINKDDGVNNELKLEMEFCVANPYMKEVYERLLKLNKKIIIISDMYLTENMIHNLLNKNGYYGFEKIYVSSEYNSSKSNGDLYKIIQKQIDNSNIIHVGDNYNTDIINASKQGWKTYYYKKTSDIKSEVDNFNMSSTVGSFYNALIKNKINNQLEKYPFDDIYYKYGFIYSGIMVLGYVNWIYNYSKSNGIDKILFLSRDGYILKKIYDKMFDDIPSEYVVWSRHATLKTAPEKDIDRYIYQFLTRYNKENSNIILKDILSNMNISFLEQELNIRNISINDCVNKRIITIVADLIKNNIDKVIESNQDFKNAAKQYYKEQVEGCKKICIVDIGYRGSGAIALKNLFYDDWNFDCEVKTLIAFGLSKTDSFDDVLNLDGSVEAYVFSELINTDLSLEFQKNQLLNIAAIDILIGSAPKPGFLYFKYNETGKLKEIYDNEEENYEIISSIHAGVNDFIDEYIKHSGNYKLLHNISGRDASAPLFYIFNQNRYKKFVEDFSATPYSLLVSGLKDNKINTLSATYHSIKNKKANNLSIEIKFKLKKIKRNFVSFKIIKKTIKIKNQFLKIMKFIKKIFSNDIMRSKFYYPKYYDSKKVRLDTFLFQSYAGDNFFGNPYYLFEEIYYRKNHKKIYVAVKKNQKNEVESFLKIKKYKKVKVIKMHSIKYCKVLATAKYLINNVSFPYYFIKKEEQIYINTWHGTPLKGLGRSIKDSPHESGNYSRNFLMADYLIMPNKYTLDIIRKDYMLKNHFKGEYILSGYPRNSIFYNFEKQKIIRDNLQLDNKKVIVYMPTWRRQSACSKNKELYPEMVNLLSKLNSELGNDSVVYIKLHNMMRKTLDLSKFSNLKEFPSEYETYEFLSIADCLITDYSSVMFDFLNLNKKIILFTYDEVEYMNGRSFYSPLSQLPFKRTNNSDVIIDYIKEKDNKPTDHLSLFCKYDNINCTKNVIDYVIYSNSNNLEIIKESQKNKFNILIYVGQFKNKKENLDLLKLLEKSDRKDFNISLAFPMRKVSKNKFIINKIPEHINYFTLQGTSNMKVKEALSFKLKDRFNNNYFKKQHSNIIKRENKRLFPNINFDMIIDFAGDSPNLLEQFINMKSKKILILDNSFLIPSLHRRYKKIVENNYNKFELVSILKDIDIKTNSIELLIQEKQELFNNNIKNSTIFPMNRLDIYKGKESKSLGKL